MPKIVGRISPADQQFRSEVAQAFKQYMHENELNQEQMARRLGVSIHSLKTYLQGSTTTIGGEVFARACILGIPLKYREQTISSAHANGKPTRTESRQLSFTFDPPLEPLDESPNESDRRKIGSARVLDSASEVVIRIRVAS